MKDKTISRKLILNKSTISSLDQKMIRGGATLCCTPECPNNTIPYTEDVTCPKTCL